MKKIIDQFTDLPVSKQRKHQLRRKAAGLCEVPGCCFPPVGKSYCKYHLKKWRQRQRKKLGCKPWHPGGKGRPPIDRKIA